MSPAKQARYLAAQEKVLAIAKEIRHFDDLEFLMQQIKMSEAVGPILDPTMFRAAQKNLEILKRSATLIMYIRENLPTVEEIIDGLMTATTFKDQRKNEVERENLR